MKRLVLLVLLSLASPARAQGEPARPSATDFYHAAAGHYIGGEREAAEEAAERGLQLAPGDARLRALLDRIRQDEQQQGGQGSQQNQQPNPNQQGGQQGQQENEGDRQQDEGRQSQQGENAPQDEQDGAASDRPEVEQPPAEQAGQPQEQGREGEPPPGAARPGEGEATPESAVPVQPGEMSRAEAERILSAVGADERLLLRRVQRQPGQGRPVEKDW